jgi:hypothetical protein
MPAKHHVEVEAHDVLTNLDKVLYPGGEFHNDCPSIACDLDPGEIADFVSCAEVAFLLEDLLKRNWYRRFVARLSSAAKIAS